MGSGLLIVDGMTIFAAKLSEHAEQGDVADLQDLFFRFTLDSFTSIGFGLGTNSVAKGKVPFAAAFDELQATIDQRLFNPFWKVAESIIGAAEIKQNLSVVRGFSASIIKSRRESQNIEERSDLLSMFMKAVNEHGNAYNDIQLGEHIINFVIAGKDTL